MANKLELTWVGKDEEIKLEPRILIENPKLSNTEKDKDTENMLIHGDNLLALKALESKYAGQIKCIYIDPPFNTGARIDAQGEEVGYEDGLEHSIWLNMMYQRFKILHTLLAKDGAIFVHLDDNEADYCKIILDEIFGRNNFMNKVTVAARSPSAFSTVNPGMFVASEYILYYAKNRGVLKEKPMKTLRDPDPAYDKYIVNIDDNYEEWKFINVGDAFTSTIDYSKIRFDKLVARYNKFIIENANRIFRLTAISDSGAGKKVVKLKYQSLKEKDRIFKLIRNDLDDIYVLNGQQIAFYSKNVVEIDGLLSATKMLTDIWTDIAWEGIAKEGDVVFKRGKKPEKLLRRCIEMVTEPNDIVLDSFLGSGTTAAVAHKMRRKYIGIELGNHAYTHCKHRLDEVVEGKDKSGITKLVNWQGGGGYKFYELAPSLIVEDKFGNPVINKEYNADMLAAAMALHEGFEYAPDANFYWKQGKNENAYIYTTTVHLTEAHLDAISKEMKEDEYLVIACKSYDADIERAYKNIKIKKIPQFLLGRCEFGKDNYNLNIVDVPVCEEESDE